MRNERAGSRHRRRGLSPAEEGWSWPGAGPFSEPGEAAAGAPSRWRRPSSGPVALHLRRRQLPRQPSRRGLRPLRWRAARAASPSPPRRLRASTPSPPSWLTSPPGPYPSQQQLLLLLLLVRASQRLLLLLLRSEGRKTGSRSLPRRPRTGPSQPAPPRRPSGPRPPPWPATASAGPPLRRSCSPLLRRRPRTTTKRTEAAALPPGRRGHHCRRRRRRQRRLAPPSSSPRP